MKILYLTPKINTEGGLERVLLLKANYFSTTFKHQITLVTQNNGNSNPFYEISNNIQLIDIDLRGNRIQFVAKYLQQVRKVITQVNPDVIVIVDSIYKAYLVGLVAKNRRIIYECHNSIVVQQHPKKSSLYSLLFSKISVLINQIGARQMPHFVALSKESLAEWKPTNSLVIPNPNWLETTEIAALDSKKILLVARHSYEKGVDRFLLIWQKVAAKYPDWKVEIIGKNAEELSYSKVVHQLGLQHSVSFLEPIKDIKSKYLDAAILVMTSRYEAFPMVLIEAMSCGLPVIAYDCPCGPRAIITHNENGFLIENGNQNAFIETLQTSIEKQEIRKKIGANAKKAAQKYNLVVIMNQWNDLINAKN